jgi:hypothetical protein
MSSHTGGHVKSENTHIETDQSRCAIGNGWHEHWRAYTLRTVGDPTFVSELPKNVRRATRLAPAWEVGSGDRTLFSGSTTLTTYGHQHADVQVGNVIAHVDLLRATGSGPGFSLTALLVHVDRNLVGRAWAFGSLGGGGNNFPAVAIVNECFTLVADFEARGYAGLPRLWLWDANAEGGS